jgi:hypothetical protein
VADELIYLMPAGKKKERERERERGRGGTMDPNISLKGMSLVI